MISTGSITDTCDVSFLRVIEDMMMPPSRCDSALGMVIEPVEITVTENCFLTIIFTFCLETKSSRLDHFAKK